jgi:hypothetical protein
MTQQKVKYPLDVHNTYWPSYDDAASEERAGRSKVHPFMVPLIEALQHKRPHWEFEAASSGNVNYGDATNENPTVLHSSFDIYDNGEKIGGIYREYKGSGTVYAARSHRISAKRQIGTSKMSKHLKTIVSEVLKECYPRTLVEIADEKYKKSQEAMQQATYKDKRAHMHSVDLMRDSMLAYLTSGDRWAEFEAAADKPSIMQAKSTYHTLAENARVASDIAVAHHILLIERPRDIVIKPFDGAAHSTSLDGLSDHIKTSLALLKMTEVDTIVEGVGIRTAEDTFYIVIKKEV